MKKYEKPEIEISVFTTEDIITSSGDAVDTDTKTLTNGGGLTDNATDGIDFNTIEWGQ